MGLVLTRHSEGGALCVAAPVLQAVSVCLLFLSVPLCSGPRAALPSLGCDSFCFLFITLAV